MPKNEAATWVPDSCSLPTAERPLRVAEFDRLFAESVLDFDRRSPTRLELSLAADALATAKDLAEREAGCCSFFGFDFELADKSVEMRIDVPTSQIAVLDALTERVRGLVGGVR